jgi:hypothetical protein
MTIKTNSLIAAFVLAGSILVTSCGNNQEKEANTEPKQDSVPAATEQPGKIYTLPAPMQVATSIKNSGAKYSESFLAPIKTGFSSDFSKLLSLGIYSADLGYAATYEQTQTSINYFSTAAKIADEVKIVGAIDAETVKRYKNNINTKDSVTYYTLSSFNKIHSNLTENNRLDEAYLIVTGCFIEGTYLASKVCEKNKSKEMLSLLGQQKLFLDNIVELMSNFPDNKDIAALVAQLNELKAIYESVEIKYADISPGVKQIQPIAISDETLAKITAKIAEIRNAAIK